MHRDLYPAAELTDPLLFIKDKVIMIIGVAEDLGAVSRNHKKCSNKFKFTPQCQIIARAWVQAGVAGIVLVGRNLDTLNFITENIVKISSSVLIISVSTDVSDESSVESVFDKVKGKLAKFTPSSRCCSDHE